MPFPYESSATPVRVRRTKDKESRSTAPSSSGRKQKRSGSSTRSPPQADRSGQLSLYSQHNPTLDQLPALPESGTASPSSAASPVLQESTVAKDQPAESSIVAHHFTPVALQKYLETDDNPSSHNRLPLQQSIQDPTRTILADVPQAPAPVWSQPLDSQTSTPLATSIREYPEPSHDPSLSPSFFNKPKSYTSASSHTPTSEIEEHQFHTIASPLLPRSSSSFVNRPVSGQNFSGLEQPQPHSYLPAFARPLAFPPAVPLNNHFPDDQSPPSAYANPPYYPVRYPNFTPMDLHSMAAQSISPYANYGVPIHNPPPSRPLERIPARGHNSTNPRMSATGEPLHTAYPPISPKKTCSSLTSPAVLKQEEEDDTIGLLQRMQSAIPDLHLLLNRFRDTSSQLGMKENLIKETEAQNTVALKQKEAHIEKLVQEVEDVKSKHSAESSKLRFEISNMEEKLKELLDNVIAEQKMKEELRLKNQSLSEDLERIHINFEDRIAKILNDLEVAKKESSENRVVDDDLERQKTEAEKSLQSRLADQRKIHAQEIDSLRTESTRQLKELETNHVQTRLELKKIVDESRRKHTEDIASWEKERCVLEKDSEEQRRILVAKHQSEKEEIEKVYEDSKAQIRLHAQEERGKLLKSSADLEIQATRLHDENIKLQRMADAFGELTDLRGRGDPFYQDAFRHLERQINDLVIEHFENFMEKLPEKAVESIRAVLPASCSNLDLTPRLRAAFVEHTISSIITRKIFAPFLFVLGGRLRSVDALFAEMSSNLKRKSSRREAVWRQRTLHAAYTASSAKNSINTVATNIVDEINGAIQDFVGSAKRHDVTIAVRRIVKLAAETWRYARLESSLIIASMDGTEIATTHDEGGASLIGMQDSGNKVLLSLFPIIRREAAYGSFEEEFRPIHQGHIYCRGRVLLVHELDTLAPEADLKREQDTQCAVPSPRNCYASQDQRLARAPQPSSPLLPTKLPATEVVRWTDQPVNEHDHTYTEDDLEKGGHPSMSEIVSLH